MTVNVDVRLRPLASIALRVLPFAALVIGERRTFHLFCRYVAPRAVKVRIGRGEWQHVNLRAEAQA